MGVKISELPVTSSAAANDKMVVNHENVTNQITVEDLMPSDAVHCLLTGIHLRQRGREYESFSVKTE